MTEILSPAGDLERLKWALMYGADAVYIGGYNYSLRANANNFSVDDIKEAVTLAHSLNKKIYVPLSSIVPCISCITGAKAKERLCWIFSYRQTWTYVIGPGSDGRIQKCYGRSFCFDIDQ